jgi:predicted O-methyltransferase YrrM
MADKDTRAGGARYTTPELLDGLRETHTPHDAALAQAFDAPEREGMPAIQLGAAEGKLVHLLLRMIGARNVVEVGTLAGYSGIWIARALSAGGHLHTIEADPKHAAVARRNFEAAGVAARVTVLEGKGADVLPTIVDRGPFDAVFIDADKGSYDVYGRWAAAHLRPGGLLLGDNAYYFGKLLDPSDPSAAAMRRFHEEAARAFDTVCMPTPDGMLVGIKR